MDKGICKELIKLIEDYTGSNYGQMPEFVIGDAKKLIELIKKEAFLLGEELLPSEEHHIHVYFTSASATYFANLNTFLIHQINDTLQKRVFTTLHELVHGYQRNRIFNS